MVGFPFEEGVLTPLENDRLNTAFGIIRGVIRDSVESSIELGFNAKKRCHFCGKPVVEGSEYCKEHKEYMSKRPNPIGEEVIRKTYEKYKDILKV